MKAPHELECIKPIDVIVHTRWIQREHKIRHWRICVALSLGGVDSIKLDVDLYRSFNRLLIMPILAGHFSLFGFFVCRILKDFFLQKHKIVYSRPFWMMYKHYSLVSVFISKGSGKCNLAGIGDFIPLIYAVLAVSSAFMPSAFPSSVHSLDASENHLWHLINWCSCRCDET